MIKYRRFLLLLAMLSVATSEMAQRTVIVKDCITHEAVPFVSVYFGNESGGYTDEQGSIAIPNGAEQIGLSHICYAITPPIIWSLRKSRTPSMPLSALTSVCQMPRPALPKTNPSSMVASYFLQTRNSVKMVSALPVLYHSPRQVYSL